MILKMQTSNNDIFSVNNNGAVATVTFNTERIDMYNVKDLLEFVKKSFPLIDFKDIIIDCNRLRYMDASAVGALMVSMGWLKKGGFSGNILFVTAKSSLYKIRDLKKLNISIFSSMEDALSHLEQSIYANK